MGISNNSMRSKNALTFDLRKTVVEEDRCGHCALIGKGRAHDVPNRCALGISTGLA